jgi:hypothetical protein
MNYLDILPNDVMKIINRKLQDAQIIKKNRKKRKQKNTEKKKTNS